MHVQTSVCFAGVPHRSALLLLTLAACEGPSRTPPPEAVFAIPADTVITAWVNIPVAAWLGDSRWVVVASEFNDVMVVDFAAGTRRPLGGPGEREIRNPFGTFAFADTAYVTDWALRRMSRWTSDGNPAGSLEAPPDFRGALPAARDAAGRYYIEVRPVPGPDGRGLRDSAAIVRTGSDFARFDTVGRLSPLDLALVDDSRGRRFERRVFSGTDQWGVLADGAIWIARVNQHKVLWLEPDGRQTLGPALPDRVIEVTATDREHFVLQFPPELRATAERLPFSPLHPPFVSARHDPTGRVWLEKGRPARDTTAQRYQVVDRTGRLEFVAVVPGRTGKLVALGDGVALLAEQYRDGVRLMQTPIPTPDPQPPSP